MTRALRGNLLRAGALVASLTAGGRVLGYARNVAVAAALGAGPAADAFFVAFRVAAFLRGLFGGRGVGAAFIPMFARLLSGAGPERARVFAGQVLCFAAAALAVAVALLELAARLFGAGRPGELARAWRAGARDAGRDGGPALEPRRGRRYTPRGGRAAAGGRRTGHANVRGVRDAGGGEPRHHGA